ncbi:MAG: flagellar export chaperone FliS [Betaproteobacteria bacterium]|nr:flagellar export chaperone FliS [Betaproteobacteria bacterium]
MNRNAINAYAKVGVDGSVAAASPHKLITMLFEGALHSIAAARGHMQRKEIAEKGMAISKAISIIDEGLRASLDLKAGGDLAEKLDSLYEYMSYRLLIANMHNEIEILDEISTLLGDIKSAWVEIDPKKIQASQKTANPPLR